MPAQSSQEQHFRPGRKSSGRPTQQKRRPDSSRIVVKKKEKGNCRRHGHGLILLAPPSSILADTDCRADSHLLLALS
jgi:hypothetical protein